MSAPGEDGKTPNGKPIPEYHSEAPKRPDHVKCVGLGYEGGPLVGITWCGRRAGKLKWRPKDAPPPGPEEHLVHWFEFAFNDPTHALLHTLNGGRLLICRECSAEMFKALDEGTS